ncbi:ComEA family DNA-binding protein [Nocardioides sp. CER19]|uniref:ComEA family DNA-binding protein n=1 Tax=Nocardioides sp. CER19 TaxID=3038538 RepID=UPI00244C4CC9|nr:ComEA family DNA-binding protein [Nocardioides sp. CER19]MDH2415472.1 ComEA family DNA-binding protein [Nocardioides sp. CER19]
MRSRPDHRDAVARRLELLRAELEPDGAPPVEEDPWWETAPVLELVPTEPDDAEPPPVPVPGRHAARRRVSASAWLGERASGAVPETLRGRTGVGPWHLTVIALFVAGSLAVTCWWVMRGDPTVTPVASGPVAPLVSVGAGTPASRGAPGTPRAPGTASATATSAGAAATVTVDVSGRVRHPGVLQLPAGSRVVDALEAAGGARPGADLSGLNRARVLVDGEQIVVGRPAAPAPGAPGSLGSLGSPGSSGSGTGAPGALVNLNTASVDELDTLPEVGPVTAQAIVDYRTEHGGFGSVDELLDIQGIGEVTLAKIAPHVTV